MFNQDSVQIKGTGVTANWDLLQVGIQAEELRICSCLQAI